MHFTFEDGIIKTPNLEFDEHCGGIGTLIYKALQEHAKKVALINTKDDTYYTYSDLLQKTTAAALALQRRGFKKGDLLAICSNKENLDANVPIFAGQFLGCVTFNLDSKLSVDECTELMNQVQPKLIFIIEEAKQLVKDTFKACGINADIVMFGKEFDENFLNTQNGLDGFEPLRTKNLQDTCMIHFSSGSTGAPKPICLNHFYFLALLKSARFNTERRTQETFLNCPMGSVSLRYANWYWISNTFEMIEFTWNGGCRILQETFNPQSIWKLIEKYHINYALFTPLQCIELSESMKPENCDTSSLTEISTGGYVLHKDYILALQTILPDTYVHQIYGMTETGVATAFKVNIPEHKRLLAERPNSCGLPVNGLYYKVINMDTGEKCGPNQPGELYLKGKKLFNGFYNRNSSESFDDEGYFRTGDLVCFDEDFCFYILDRIKAVIGWMDWLIYPHHIENVLQKHPCVDVVVVIGIPHKIEGEIMMGVVVLKENCPSVSENELVDYVAKRVQDHKRLRGGIKFVKYLPTTITGKINRLKVKEMVLKSLKMENN